MKMNVNNGTIHYTDSGTWACTHTLYCGATDLDLLHIGNFKAVMTEN